jgi:putative FmdB family regulatory protein
MPMYEYQCAGCGGTFEVLQKFSDAPKEVCDVCGGKLEKLISSPAFQFKGSGWYVTDYAKSKGGGAAASKPAETRSSDSSTSTATPAPSTTPSAS